MLGGADPRVLAVIAPPFLFPIPSSSCTSGAGGPLITRKLLDGAEFAIAHMRRRRRPNATLVVILLSLLAKLLE